MFEHDNIFQRQLERSFSLCTCMRVCECHMDAKEHDTEKKRAETKLKEITSDRI